MYLILFPFSLVVGSGFSLSKSSPAAAAAAVDEATGAPDSEMVAGLGSEAEGADEDDEPEVVGTSIADSDSEAVGSAIVSLDEVTLLPALTLTLLVIMGVNEVKVIEVDVEADKAVADGAGSEEGPVDVGPGVIVDISDEVEMDDITADSDHVEEDDMVVGEGAARTARVPFEGANVVSLFPEGYIPSSGLVALNATSGAVPEGASSACATPSTAGFKPSPSTREPRDLALRAGVAVDRGM